MSTVVGSSEEPGFSRRQRIEHDQRYRKARNLLVELAVLKKDSSTIETAKNLVDQIMEIYPKTDTSLEAQKIHRTLIRDFGFSPGTVLLGSPTCPVTSGK